MKAARFLSRPTLTLGTKKTLIYMSVSTFMSVLPSVLSVRGAFENYIDRRGWVGDESNVYVSKYLKSSSISPSKVI